MDSQTAVMLAALGYATLDELTASAIPASILATKRIAQLPSPHSEEETRQRVIELAGMNNSARSLIGLGYHGTITPAPIRRGILQNPAWYTAYTPYQPEISQGRLEALMTFQTMVSDLTGLPVAGASLLDEATAVAEAVAVARRSVKTGTQVVLDADLLPNSQAVLATRTQALSIDLATADDLAAAVSAGDPFAVVVQVPGCNGRIRALDELKSLASATHAKGALLIAACDPLALAILDAPAEWGADIVVGSTQRFGVPLFFGGPHAGYIAVRSGLERQLPGRLVGLSKDAAGVEAYRLALQTREQHIRREKATSNICTAQVLLAVAAGCYAVWHGPEGLAEIANSIHGKAVQIARRLRECGFQLACESFFDTLRVHTPKAAAKIAQDARAAGLLLAHIDADWIGISVGEDLTDSEADKLCEIFAAHRQPSANPDQAAFDLAGHSRRTRYLTHPVFNSYHDETEFVRYLRALQDRDYALDRGMIPLGSCTMKLNPTVAMESISYPGFAELHPLAGESDSLGYRELIDELCRWLAAITGYDAVSVQPNAGSQGEFAGLLAIRGWHEANGSPQRDICLIPASAHGTNAASAALAGFKVVQVANAPDGAIDTVDLAAKIDA
ncbi:MAG: glycine dehydrogenase (aminomethyl-transferring), partial [Propionibacteriaceae bacterium]|nr:glycine dehydrogenase (aminomethyl-transferring) [Propionibacteriaceae bacterium]